MRRHLRSTSRDLLLRLYGSHALAYFDAKSEVIAAQVVAHGQCSGVRTRWRRPSLANDEWRVLDAVVNGVSAIHTLCYAVGADIDHYGLDGTTARLREKLDERRPPSP